MEKAVRKLMSNTIKLRNWTTLSNCIATHNPLLNSVDPLEDNLTLKELQNKKGNIGKFLNVDLRDDSTNIVKSSEPNCTNMNGKQAIKMIRNLDISLKKGMHISDINKSAKFLQMCQLIQKDARSLDVGHVIQALEILLYFNVPVNSILVITLLQLLRTSVNNLSMGQIIYVYSILYNQQNSSLVKVLIEALPHVFRNQVRIEIDMRNMHTLIQALSFACLMRDLQTINYIMDIMCANRGKINIWYATTTLRALRILPYLSQCSITVLLKMKEVIVKNYTFLNYREINNILLFMDHKYKNGIIQLYCENVVNSLCTAVIHKNLSFTQSIQILSKLNKLFHSNISLLNHVTKRFFEDMDIIKSCSSFHMYILIRSFVIADYKPYNWDTMKTVLANSIANEDFSIHHLASITYRMMSLDCYCPKLLEKVFTLYYCVFDTLQDKGALWHTLKLHQAVTCLYPQYNGLRLSQDMIDKLVTMVLFEELYPLGQHLQNAVGGAKYVKSGLRTKFGDFIEHIIALQPDGSPMTINDYNNNIRFVEDLLLPPDCHKILVFVFPKIAYSNNLQNMQSTWRLLLRVIEMSTGCKTLPINPYLWERIPKYKKNMHLREAIKNKFNEISSCAYR